MYAALQTWGVIEAAAAVAKRLCFVLQSDVTVVGQPPIIPDEVHIKPIYGCVFLGRWSVYQICERENVVEIAIWIHLWGAKND